MLCDECHKHEASIYVTEITSQGQIAILFLASNSGIFIAPSKCPSLYSCLLLTSIITAQIGRASCRERV